MPRLRELMSSAFNAATLVRVKSAGFASTQSGLRSEAVREYEAKPNIEERSGKDWQSLFYIHVRDCIRTIQVRHVLMRAAITL